LPRSTFASIPVGDNQIDHWKAEEIELESRLVILAGTKEQLPKQNNQDINQINNPSSERIFPGHDKCLESAVVTM
jgi:hypothetical protein